MTTEPLHLTPLEQQVDDLMRFENWERYSQQSSKTRNAQVGQLPPRLFSPLIHGPQFNSYFAKR